MMQQHLFPGSTALSEHAASFLADTIINTVRAKGECSVFLSGGNTPRKCYEHLGGLLAASIQYPRLKSHVHWFLGDERYVLIDDSDRNEKMVRESLFQTYTPDEESLHFWESPPLPPAVCAEHYDTLLNSFFKNKNPDIILLGLGTDGHTASLFPGALAEQVNGVRTPLSEAMPASAIAVYIPKKKLYRLSLTAGFLKTASHIVFLASGAEKREAYAKLIQRNKSVPSAWIAGENTIFFVTEDIKS